jgi:hypothetical protein
LATNINITTPHFCRGPRSGAFSIIFSGVGGVLRVISEAGALLHEYDLSSDITNTLLSFEYIGPIGITAMVDGLTYFTLEKVSDSQCLIKRWEINTGTLSLDLKQTITKTTVGNYCYDANAGAIEYYGRSFGNTTTSGVNNIEINNTSRIESGMKLFLGPSNHTANIDAVEWVEVDYTSGTDVYLTSDIDYKYLTNDSITTYNNYYVISNLGYGGDVRKGSVFKLDAYDGSYIEMTTGGDYKSISVTKWHPAVDGIACVIENNLLFIRPYNSYLKWKSQNMNNIEEDGVTLIEVHDVTFDSNSTYKLMKKVTWRDDSGNRNTENWGSYYNFHADTLLPYTNSINLYTDQSYFIGANDTATINIKVIDQFGIGLNNLTVTVSKASGDPGGSLVPADGVVTTDANGETSVQYTSGSSYNESTVLKAKVGSGYTGNGSAWVWNSISLLSRIDYQIPQVETAEYSVGVYQVEDEFVASPQIIKQILDSFLNTMSVIGKTYFTTPGGDWVNPSTYAGQAKAYLPMLPIGEGDGPAAGFFGWPPLPHGSPPPAIPNNIRQVLDFESETPIDQFDYFVSVIDRIKQIAEAEHDLQISQLKLSFHTHWVDGVAYDELFTNVELNQFVFIEDAIPAFWSEKNPKNTDIWIRLRPFAFDLDITTLIFLVREVSYEGDTGFIDVTSQCTVTTFDAGGGLDGLDVLYNPTQDFHYNATVYVHIEVYDKSAIPNFIYVDYWFKIVPDLRFPYLENLNPDRDQTYVPINTDVYFEIKDDGAGVDIDTLDLYVNSRTVTPTSVIKVADNHYKVAYNPLEDFYYNKEIKINIVVSDIIGNTLNDGYRFYTVEGDSPQFIGVNPKICKRGVERFQDISLLALTGNDGLDKDSIRVQLHGIDVTDKSNFLPVVYRVEETTYSGGVTLSISDLSIQEGDYIPTTGSVYVDLVDFSHNITISGSCFKVNNVTVSGSFSPIIDGYRMTYDPQDDFEEFIGETKFTARAQNDNGNIAEKDFYLTFGYLIEYDNSKADGIDLGYGEKVLIRVAAENIATCPTENAYAYWILPVENVPKDLTATITGVPKFPPLSETYLSASIYPQSTAFGYGKEFTIVLTAKDHSENEMTPYVMKFKVEDKI